MLCYVMNTVSVFIAEVVLKQHRSTLACTGRSRAWVSRCFSSR